MMPDDQDYRDRRGAEEMTTTELEESGFFTKAPEVLPQGVHWNDADLWHAYVAGVQGEHVSLTAVTPGSITARAADAYVKLAHLKRLERAAVAVEQMRQAYQGDLVDALDDPLNADASAYASPLGKALASVFVLADEIDLARAGRQGAEQRLAQVRAIADQALRSGLAHGPMDEIRAVLDAPSL